MLTVQGVSVAEQAPKVGKGVESVARKDGPILSTLKKKREAEARNEAPSKKTKVDSEERETRNDPKFATVDPFIDAENKEIARLEKLMGIKGGKPMSCNA
jgi:hypothetical protein